MRVLRVMAVDVAVWVAEVTLALTVWLWAPPLLLVSALRKWWQSAKDRAE